MVPRDWVLDHSEVMTALKGYSAPIPVQLATLDTTSTTILTNAHDEAPPDEQAEKRHVIVAMAARRHANRRNYDEYQLDSVKPCASVIVGKEAKGELSND